MENGEWRTLSIVNYPLSIFKELVMSNSRRVEIDLIGAGFLAETRAHCYTQVSGTNAQIGAVAASSEASAATYAQRHNVPKFFTDYRDLLALPEVDMIDLCLPNHLHRPVAGRLAAVADVWGLTLLIQLGAGIGILSALLALFLPKTGAVISSAAAKSVPA
jgi:hypothetical protein